MPPRRPFTLRDLRAECRVEEGVTRLDDERGERWLGLHVHVAEALRGTYPYNASAYAFLQELRPAIRDYGLITFPELPLNPTNHTLAQRAPWEHGYSANPYLTGHCQAPHQDTPPYPTAFWLPAERRYFVTWVLSELGVARYADARRAAPMESEEALHAALVPRSLDAQWGTLVNHEPGLLLLDNSDVTRLYHARTRRPTYAIGAAAGHPDTPSHAFNEVGLLNYIDTLDERRGDAHRSAEDRAEVEAFLAAEG